MSAGINLAGQAALVTGASSGIGRACALALAEAGAGVVVNYASDETGANGVVRQIAACGGDAIAVEADVSDERQVEDLFRKACGHFGTLHILVNNAGIQRDGPTAEMTLEQWRRVIDVNLTGQFLCARAAIREFLRRGIDRNLSPAAGKIVCVSSVHQVIPWAGHVNYAASKGGVALMAETLAQEFAPRGIRVNIVAPGAIRTNINRAAWETEEAKNDLLRLIPYGRVGDSEDVARAIAWLCSDEADYVTGATLPVDGGMLLYPGFQEGHG